ncbi:uncharacterized protein LOC110026802 [Phalaenopsis equestris]|uniref:uncharacterized protein LOC110026802 n=1 Tax=Phalaenopsis equestris TaxID=78828 RepID=UPI0009E27F1D|nr:uncharacterized protein LOC110026802 [Phalaenopsis equestris]
MMGDHLALLVDRLLTEATLAAAIESRRMSESGHNTLVPNASGSELTQKRIAVNGPNGGKLVECRICQDEDEDCNLEAPCSCRGSLKFAHRKCIQQWCNEKGDTTCEICRQQFKPGYTAPSQLFHYGGVPMNFRGSWGVSRREVHDSQIITIVPSDRSFMNSDYDYYASTSARSSMYCRSVAIIFMAVLVLLHTLPIFLNLSEDDEQNSLTLFGMLALGIAGIILPVIIVIRVVIAFQCRQHYQRAHGITVAGEQIVS